VRVKPSNKVIINCVCIFVLLLLAGLYTYSFTNFTMTRVGEAPRDAELPFLRVSEKPDGVYTLKGQMTVRPLSPHEYFIVVE